MSVRTIIGDCRDELKTLPSESVHCCVTSPPYWGLRDYGVAGQIGLEPTMEEFLHEMVTVFREVRRVLRKDGTLWLNLGDSYAGSNMTGGNASINAHGGADGFKMKRQFYRKLDLGDLKPKDLCGIPWRVAFALQADGWWLRQDIIWAKPNPMPESVTDRCTKAHEYIFLMSKDARYCYDASSIAIPSAYPGDDRARRPDLRKLADPMCMDGGSRNRTGRPTGETVNKRSVWEVATAPFSQAHFATFPPALIEPCILAGTSEKGCCAKCGAPWRRETSHAASTGGNRFAYARTSAIGDGRDNDAGRHDLPPPARITTGWSASCRCDAPAIPCTVLDPFGGAGTTGLVADRLQRNAIMIELNPAYAAMADKRISDDAPLFYEVS